VVTDFEIENASLLIVQVFEDPQSSLLAKCVAYVDITMIMIAITSVCVETLPSFRHEQDSPEMKAR
jgi:hypothetical protein